MIEYHHRKSQIRDRGVITLNKAKLKSKMVENSITVHDLSLALGISQSTFYRKLNSGADFTIGEATQIATKLNMTAEELTNIFLSK